MHIFHISHIRGAWHRNGTGDLAAQECASVFVLTCEEYMDIRHLVQQTGVCLTELANNCVCLTGWLTIVCLTELTNNCVCLTELINNCVCLTELTNNCVGLTKLANNCVCLTELTNNCVFDRAD